MKKRFIRRAVSLATSALLLLTSAPFAAAAALEGPRQERYAPNSELKAVTADSYQTGYEPVKAFDGITGNPGNCWHTPWGEDMTDFPHWIMAEYREPQRLDALVYIPRDPVDYQFATKYEVWASPNADEANLKKITEGEWERGEQGMAEFAAQDVQLIKLVILEKTDANQNPEDHSMAVAELKMRLAPDAVDPYVPVSEVKTATASSFQPAYEAIKAFDGIEDVNNCWHTPWEGDKLPGLPHWIMAELENPQHIDGLLYVPRSPDGYQYISEYEIWVSPDADENNLQKVAEGTWERGFSSLAEFPAQDVQLVKLVILGKADANGSLEDYSISASEIKLRLTEAAPVPQPDRYVSAEEIESATASSFQPGYEPDKAFDGVEEINNCWHTPWEGDVPAFPHWIMAKFKTTQYIDGVTCIPRDPTIYQYVTRYEIWVSPDDDESNLKKVAEGSWEPFTAGKAQFPVQEARLVKFVVLEKYDTNMNPEDTSVSISELKFRQNKNVEGGFDAEILRTLGRANKVLDYAGERQGQGEHDIKPAAYEALESAARVLEDMLGSGDSQAVLRQISRVEESITSLLGSNMTAEEELYIDIPSAMLGVSANSSNAGYLPGKAIDGNSGTIWHSEWTPESDPFPHIFTIDLQKKMLLKHISISPRQDMDSGKITRGQVYVGDSLSNMTLAAEFSGAAGRETTVVDLNFASGRYVQIYSLASTSENTAISEVAISTYDRGIAGAFQRYDDALNMLRKASVGENIGDHSQDDVNAFEKTVAGYGAELQPDNLTVEDYYDISDRISKGCVDFAAKAKTYSKEELKDAMELLENRLDTITQEKDKTAARALLEEAKGLYENSSAAREAIHELCGRLLDFLAALDAAGEAELNLAGEWGLAMAAYSDTLSMTSRVTLPGTLDTNKEGLYNAFDDIARLSRYYTYSGPAVYQKNLFISEEWAGKNIGLYMERTRWTRVWVNGVEISAPDSANIISVSQQYDITDAVLFGQYNTIAIQVTNTYEGLNGIASSHMATDETQTNWNGILGEFKLQAREPAHINDLRVYPNDDLKSAKVEVDVCNSGDEDYTGRLTLQCEEGSAQMLNVSLTAGEIKTFTLAEYAMPDNVKLWSEFDRPLYEMTAELDNGEKAAETFGMRAFRSENSGFTINGDKVFLRSEANCAVFPLTGYAPMDEAGWEKLFGTYQSYGINAVRFHSWCPPDAAFRVADRMGLYLQPELSCWDSPMLGDEARRTYYTKEAFAIIKEYANHPSFVMFSFGNELGYSGNDYIEQGDKLVKALKDADPTRLYAPGSNVHFSSVDPSPHADYYTAQAFWGADLRGAYAGMGGFINQKYPSSAVNYNETVKRIDAFDVPVFSFEVGQFQVFPDVLTEIEQYTGVLEARNLKMMAEKAAEQGMTEEDIRKAIEATGMLSRLAYRAEIEAALRTEGMDGISLLGIQDFPGQGTALVGMVNALGDPKPYAFADPDVFSDFFAPVVPLLEVEKFSWTNAETLTGTIKLSNYGPDDLNEKISYKMTDLDGKVFYKGETDTATFEQGGLTQAGTISIPLDAVQEPTQFTIEIACEDGKNSYNVWVYPADRQAAEADVYVTDYLDDLALQVLAEGGKVLLSPRATKEALPQSVAGTFTTSFWSTGFVGETQPGSMGLLLDPAHPLFDSFPTDYYADYQWWAMSTLGRPMNLESLIDDAGNRIQPIVRMLDDFDSMKNMGLLFEAAVGKGKLMVSSMGLEQLQNEYPEAKALRNAILEYMNSDAFDPDFQVEVEQINDLIKPIPGEERENLADRYHGGKAFLGENTGNQQGGYDNRYPDRLLEINDGVSDISLASRSWSDWDASGNYPYDGEIGVELDGEHMVDTVAFSFFEDEGCQAPAGIQVQYWNGRRYVNVSRQSQGKDFVTGMNTITFAPVQTDKLLFVMEHRPGMALAISEMYVYEKQVNPESIRIRGENGAVALRENETLQLYIDTEPTYANNRNVKWTVEDVNGNPSDLARVGFDGVLRPSGVGKVIVKAALRSDPTITASLEIAIVDKDNPEPVVKGDLDKDGRVTIADVMEACKILARKSADIEPTADEIARGDLDGDGAVTIADVMEICKLLARQQ